MAFTDMQQTAVSGWDTLQDEISTEIKKIERRLRDNNKKLEQSRAEVAKLAQRNTRISTQIQKINNQSDAKSNQEITTIYDDALNTQQRLFVVRGQVEKLQSDKDNLESHKITLDHLHSAFVEGINNISDQGAAPGSAFTTIEAIIQAQEAERQRLSKQMHDGPAQALSNFVLQTEIALRLFDVDQEKAREELLDLKNSATSAFQQVRQFIFELRPMMLDDLGLVPTLKRYIEEAKEQTKIQINLSVTGIERRLESSIEVVVFRAVQELLGFAHRHSQAGQVKVHVDISNTNVKVNVEDNGKGFEGDAIFEVGGLAVKAIKDRVEMLGGNMEVDSDPGRGALIAFQIPVDTAEITADGNR